MGTRKDRKAGFTLTEAVIASALLLMIAGGFLLTAMSAMRTHAMSRDFYRATCIARNRIQRAHALDYQSLSLLRETDARVDELGNTHAVGAFRRDTLVTNVVPNCTRIRVSVRYPARRGELSVQPVMIETLITEGL